MATTLSEFPRIAGGKGIYPWATWLDGQVWILKPGEDFDCKLDSMASIALAAATRAGVKLKLSQRGGVLAIQAIR